MMEGDGVDAGGGKDAFMSAGDRVDYRVLQEHQPRDGQECVDEEHV